MRRYRSAFSFWLILLVLGIPLALVLRPNIEASQPKMEQAVGSQALIVLPTSWRDDAAVSLAASDLSALLASAYQFQPTVVYDTDVTSLGPFAFVIGDASNTWLSTLENAQASSGIQMPAEGFHIVQEMHGVASVTRIQGADLLGSVYGVFHLIDLLRLNRQTLFEPLDIMRSPQMTLRAVSDPTGSTMYPSPEDALRAGYNTVFIEPWPGLISYADFDPAITAPDKYASYTAWVEQNRKKAGDEIARARQLHLRIATMGDVISFPRQTLSIYRTQATYDDDLTRFCIAKQRTRDLLSYSLDNLLTTLPEIDYVMVRTGENYSSGPLTGNNPAIGNKAACGNLDDVRRLQLVINTVYDQVVTRHGKTYIHRAWDLGENGFHANPDYARAVLSGVPNRDKLIVSFKQTKTDYWRFNGMNPNIGTQDVSQMIEEQVAREYEGKGAFPNYVGGLIADGGEEDRPPAGLEYAYQHGVRAVWVWAKGGGWGGPELRSTVWLDANFYAVSRLIWDTQASPEVLAQDWATLRFGPKAASKVAEVLMKSDDVVLGALYVGPLGNKRRGWTPNHLWVRDDIIQGGDALTQIYQATKDDKDFQATLREKAVALELLDSMIADYKEAMPLAEDRELAERVLNTLTYERSLVETLNHYLIGMLHYYRWLDSNKKNATERAAATTELRSWQDSWTHYTTVVAALPGVATPYRDSGMVKTATSALQQLQEVK
ncbi:MAG: hypothetical protein EPO21_10100 [Chloroflexota bacterium]|nr:MAG: hypothetical protein EPO21_10100 [Chloroflexota bacterium]